jgi:hypothetical protein
MSGEMHLLVKTSIVLTLCNPWCVQSIFQINNIGLVRQPGWLSHKSMQNAGHFAVF